GVVPDNASPDNIFTGGSTGDLEDIGTSPTNIRAKSWLWVARSGGPDKDDIQNGFAAAYRTDPYDNGAVHSPSGDLILYAGGDRFDNSGDAQLGFWFIQQGMFNLSDGHFH